LVWFVDQHALEEIQCLRISIRNYFAEFNFFPHRERRFEVGQCGASLPDVFIRCTERAEDLEKLVNFGVPREDGTLGEHFSENTTGRPDIDWCRVRLGAQQDFRCAVPQGNDLVSVRAYRNAKSTGKTKICKL